MSSQADSQTTNHGGQLVAQVLKVLTSFLLFINSSIHYHLLLIKSIYASVMVTCIENFKCLTRGINFFSRFICVYWHGRTPGEVGGIDFRTTSFLSVLRKFLCDVSMSSQLSQGGIV